MIAANGRCDEGHNLENHCPLFFSPAAGRRPYLFGRLSSTRVCRLFLEARTCGDDRARHDPRETEPRLRVDDAGPGAQAGDALDDGQEAPGQVIAGVAVQPHAQIRARLCQE